MKKKKMNSRETKEKVDGDGDEEEDAKKSSTNKIN